MWRLTLRGMLAHKLRLALTALSIILGVTFVTGTLVLGDTLNRTFNGLIGNVYQHVSFEVRGKAEFSDSGAGSVDGTSNRKAVPESVIGTIRGIPGVQFAYGSVSGYAQMIAPDGKVIGHSGQALGFSFDPNPQLSALKLVQGHAPSASDDVVIDKATADKYRFKVGQHVRILLSGPTRTFTITGVATFGSDNNLVGTTLAAFDLPTAQRLFGSVGQFAAINILAKPGADNVVLERQIRQALPADLQVLTGAQAANQITNSIDHDLSFITTALLIFAFISLFVGAFTIFNTFSITVGQRTRELALLRVVGASRRQLLNSVLSEAALTGLIASLVGLGLGVVAAVGLRALLKAFSLTLPSAPLVFEARTPIVAIAIGVLVTLFSAIIPAIRAVRVPPVAALGANTEARRETSRGRRIAGAIFTLLGALSIIGGVHKAHIGSVGLGALLLFVGASLLLPVLASPLAGVIGKPLALLTGTPGRLGRENALRSPKRTAQTAAALMIGIALVSTITVLGSSLSKSATQSVDNAVRADYLVTADTVSAQVPKLIATVPGVSAVTTIYQGQFEVTGSVSSLVAASPRNLPRTISLGLTSGRGAPALAAGELLVDTTTARSDHLRVGSTLAMTFARTGRTSVRVGGIFKPNSLVGSFVVSDAFFKAHFDDPLPTVALVAARPGAGNLLPALNSTLRAYPSLKIRTRAQFEQDEENNVNSLLDLVYVLLALAVLVALIGIVNTLMLSVFERTREIGLLRAVGMTRRQVIGMISSESIVIALFGAVVGIVVGSLLGAALASSLRNNGVTVVSLPLARLIAFLIIAGVMGFLASIWPALRASKLDVLGAIATD